MEPVSKSKRFSVSQLWLESYPGAHVGVLAVRGVSNPARHEGLEVRKAALETELRSAYAAMDRAALRRNKVLAAYEDYYRGFKKTYHVQLQLESILFKGRTVPSAAALVEAMFMAELKGLLLTAGHDLDVTQGELTLDVARGTETYTILRGEAQTPKAGDMMISDAEGIISTIIYGPDQRTQIRPETRAAVFTIYAPNGIAPDDIHAQLNEILSNARLIAPAAEVELLAIFPDS